MLILFYLVYQMIRCIPPDWLRAVPLKNPRTGKTPSLKFDPPGPGFLKFLDPPAPRFAKLIRPPTPRFSFVPQTPNSKIFMVIWP